MKKLIDVIEQIDDNFNVAGLEGIWQALNKVKRQAKQELASNRWFEGKAVKQLVTFYNLMDNLNQQWPDLQKLMQETPPAIQEIQPLLVSATKDSVFGRLAKAMGLSTPHAPGLDPGSLVNALTNTIRQEGGVEAVTKLFQQTQGMPTTTTEGEPKFAAGPASAEPPTQAAGAQTAQRTAETGDTETTQSSTPGSKEVDLEKVARDVISKERLPAEQIGLYQSIMNIVQKHGYDIKPRD